MEPFRRAGLRNHLDADMLAAFAERSLRGDQEAAVFGHLAECEICREYLAAHSELSDFQWHNGQPHDRRLPRLLRTRRCFLPARRPLFGCCSHRPAARRWRLPSRSGCGTNALCAAKQNSYGCDPGEEAGPPFFGGGESNRTSGGNPPPILQLSSSAGLRKLSTGDRLAARNSQRFRDEVTLATVSFKSQRTAGQGDREASSLNQIALKTPFGDRRITLEGERRFTLLP